MLVLLDLASGYIFVESPASDRRYETWHERVQQAIGSVAEVKYLVSDRAKALVKLALVGLGCGSIPDVFHALRDLSRPIGSQLGRQLSQLAKQISQADEKLTHLQVEGKHSQAQQERITQLRTQYSWLQSTQATYHSLMQQLSLCVHPNAYDGSGFQSATQVVASLQQHLQALAQLSKASDLSNLPAALDKFTERMFEKLLN